MSGATAAALELNALSPESPAIHIIATAADDQPEALDPRRATEGLAPLIRAEIRACLARLKQEGQAILLVDKHLDALTKIADRHVVIEKGRVVWTGTSAALKADASVKEKYLQVDGIVIPGRAERANPKSIPAFRHL